MFPAIPQLQPNPTTGLNAKLPEDQLTKMYNELTELGLCVVAKRRTAKFPVQKNWQNLSRKDRDFRTQLQIQAENFASGWCVVTGHASGGLVVVDLDFNDIREAGEDPHEVYRQIQTLSATRFVLSTPTGGLHLYYNVPVGKPLLKNRAGAGIKGLDIRGEGGQVASLGGFNRYTDNYDKKGVVKNHEGTYSKLIDGDYTHIPEMSDALYDHLSTQPATTKELSGNNFGTDAMVRNYEKTESGNERLDAHMKQPMERREAIVKECLTIVFDKWGNTLSNDEWTQVWMAAHHGAPTNGVRDFIINNPDVHWSDGNEGKRLFAQRWTRHNWQENGYTVASLFWIAKKAGWLLDTGYEIPEDAVENINVQFVSDWLKAETEIPTRLLIESQTGSGKTTAIKLLWERAGKPRTVIFVPTVKLATELHHSLIRQDMPSTLYRDDIKGKAIDIESMREAQILVTTLQTFATRLFASGTPLRNYGLVYIEEIDQLLSGFARGGGGFYMSHVTETQARLGFQVLNEAYKDSKIVWGVDATMSQVSSSMAHRLTEGQIRIIRNNHIKEKPPVTFVKDYESAYQVAYKSLKRNKKVVIICDTANKAVEAHRLMVQMKAVTEEEAIVLTRHTSQKSEVIDFMKDVNKGASRYKLVVYNSIMGSGVSITDVTPDVIVQMSHYLTPRNNLQMLNRYRSQSEVYCYYQTGENLYTKTREDILKEVTESVEIESNLIRLPLIARTDVAAMRDSLSSISVADEQSQRRSPITFYQSLLHRDGRKTLTEDVEVSGILAHNIKKVRELQRTEQQYIAKNWHTVRPITQEDPADENMTDIEVALGLQHGVIFRALKGNVPDVDDTEFAEYVHKVVTQMRPYSFVLSEFMTQEKALHRAERHIIDGDKALTAINTNISTIKIVSFVKTLYDKMNTEVQPDRVESHSRLFLNQLRDNKALYDSVMRRSRDKFDMVWNEEDPVETAIQFSKLLLRQIGLRQKKRRTRAHGEDKRTLYISNLTEAADFLRWRHKDDENFAFDYSFSTGLMDSAIEARQEAADIFRAMSKSRQKEVTRLVTDDMLTFKEAVERIQSGIVM